MNFGVGTYGIALIAGLLTTCHLASYHWFRSSWALQSRHTGWGRGLSRAA